MPVYDIPESLDAWIRSGDRGISSNAIVKHLTGFPCSQSNYDWPGDHPSDPADLGRCLRLLQRVPELQPKFRKMRNVSPVWAALVDHWEELAALYYEELPTGRARKCYARMQFLIEGASNHDTSPRGPKEKPKEPTDTSRSRA